MTERMLVSMRANAVSLEQELDWFSRVLESGFRLCFGQACDHSSIRDIAPPALAGQESEYARLVATLNMSFDERLVLMLALVPHIRPQLLDTLLISNKGLGRSFTEFGGWSGQHHGGFQPTGETAAFLLAGSDLAQRFEMLRLFDP